MYFSQSLSPCAQTAYSKRRRIEAICRARLRACERRGPRNQARIRSRDRAVLAELSSYHRVPSSPGITHRPSAATRPISMPTYPVHDELSGSQVLMDVITLSGPHAEPGAGGSALAMGVLKPSVSIAAAA